MKITDVTLSTRERNSKRPSSPPTARWTRCNPKCTHCASIWLSKTKSVGIFQKRQVSKTSRLKARIAGVIFGELYAQKEIFESGKKAVGDVLVPRHAAMQRLAAYDSRTQHHVVHVVSHHAGHRRDEQRGVLVIGVDHDDDVGPGREGFAITGLLVAAISVVPVVHEGLQPKALAREAVLFRTVSRPPGC